jgi:hypothetical protein
MAIHQLFVEDFVAEINAFVADVDAWSGNQLADLLLGLATEGAFQMGVELGHRRRVGRNKEGTGAAADSKDHLELSGVCSP